MPALKDVSVDSPFAGVWRGEIYKPNYGYLLSWVHDMHPDGTYTDSFTRNYPDGSKYEFSESGKWWVDGDKYFEILPGIMNKPDEYKILFKAEHYFVIQIYKPDESTRIPGLDAIYVHRK